MDSLGVPALLNWDLGHREVAAMVAFRAHVNLWQRSRRPHHLYPKALPLIPSVTRICLRLAVAGSTDGMMMLLPF